MRIEWYIEDQDISHVKQLIADQEGRILVQVRRKVNLALDKPSVTKERLWKAMVCMRLTTRQRSGPDSVVAKFNRAFPLDYSKMLQNTSEAERLILDTLVAHKVLRDRNTIAAQLTKNFYRLESGEWDTALAQCNQLTRNSTRILEVKVAKYIATFAGIGQKQSRNILQALGLTRYEIPIDSRVTGWLNELNFPIKLSANALQDGNYYNFISEGIQHLCRAVEVEPCILDASIFASKDKHEWTEEEIVY